MRPIKCAFAALLTMMFALLSTALASLALVPWALAQEDSDSLNVETGIGTETAPSNQELPKILYVVPWKDVTGGANQTQQKLSLHDFFGDLYEPLIPSKVQDGQEPALDSLEGISTKAKTEGTGLEIGEPE